MKTLTNRLDRKFEPYQPQEQAGFRKDHNTTKHLHAVRQLLENSIEYKIQLWLAFID